MSYDYSLIGVFPGADPEVDAVKKAAEAVGVEPGTIPLEEPRFFLDGLLVASIESDEEERQLAKRTLGYENNMSLILADYSRADDKMMIRLMRNILKIALAFANDPGFRGDLIVDYSDQSYLAHISEGALVLNERFWGPWEAASEVLAVVPEPHQFADLRTKS